MKILKGSTVFVYGAVTDLAMQSTFLRSHCYHNNQDSQDLYSSEDYVSKRRDKKQTNKKIIFFKKMYWMEEET